MPEPTYGGTGYGNAKWQIVGQQEGGREARGDEDRRAEGCGGESARE
jgi:hypothetical protein